MKILGQVQSKVKELKELKELVKDTNVFDLAVYSERISEIHSELAAIKITIESTGI